MILISTNIRYMRILANAMPLNGNGLSPLFSIYRSTKEERRYTEVDSDERRLKTADLTISRFKHIKCDNTEMTD